MKIVPGLLVKLSEGHVFAHDPTRKGSVIMLGSGSRYRVLAMCAESAVLKSKHGDLLIMPEGILAGPYVLPAAAIVNLAYCPEDPVTSAWLQAE